MGRRGFFFISGSTLKLLAVTAMLVDHIGHYIARDNELFMQVLCTIGSRDITPYFLMRAFGRMAFPLFAFLLVEGFVHTHDRVRYGRNLLLFALISEIPWNLLHANTWHHPSQNVFFTLLLGYLALCSLSYWHAQPKRRALFMLLLLALSILLRADYGCRGFAFIIMLYALRDSLLLKSVIGCGFLPGTWMSGMAFIPIAMYNGERGFIRGSFGKYLFYAFYPAHLMIIYLLRVYGL